MKVNFMDFVGLKELKAGVPFCTAGAPSLKGDELSWSFGWEQFEAAQAAISGAEFGETIEESIAWFLDRGEYLAGQAGLNEYSYHPVMGYCSYGWFENEGVLYLWYETTRGTILAQFSDGTETGFQVMLPASRKGGFHNECLDYAKAGRTLGDQRRWENAYLDPESDAYREFAEWHNQHMVGLGYEPMLTQQQLILKRRTEKVLKCVHGDWAVKYGIGEMIAEMIGREGGVTAPHARQVEIAEYVRERLLDALCDWNRLMTEIRSLPDYPGEDVDYEEAEE